MTRVFLHLGPPKTATTSIQHSVAHLQSLGLIQAQSKREISTFHNLSANLVAGTPASEDLFIKFIYDKLASCSSEPLILSSENLSNIYNLDNPSIVAKLKGFFDELPTELIFTLNSTCRRIDSTIAEAVKQSLVFSKKNEVLSFIENSNYFNVQRLIVSPCLIFRPRAVKLINIEGCRNVPSKFLKSILSPSHYSRCAPHLDQLANLRFNKSPSPAGVALMNDLNRAIASRFPQSSHRDRLWSSIAFYNMAINDCSFREVFRSMPSSFAEFYEELEGAEEITSLLLRISSNFDKEVAALPEQVLPSCILL